MTHELGAVILAAGLSSRMGAFKPLLELGGETLIGRAVGLMRRAGAEKIAVVTGHRHREVEEALRGTGALTVLNENYAHSQMIDSMLLGFEAVSDCARILEMPVDVPLVRDETVALLLRERAPFVRPVCQGKYGHPVLLESGIIPVIRANSEFGLKIAVETGGVAIRDLPVEDVGTVTQANTPEEFRRVVEMFEEARR